MSPFDAACKRALDIALAGAGLALAALPMAAIAAAVYATDPGPIFFRQTRIGRGGRPFTIHKFRTMYDAPPPPSGYEPGRRHAVTPVGAFLRRTKLDELPQLLDVLRGVMSLVGPRPEVPEWFGRHRPDDRAALAACKPGLTDFATLRLADEEALLAAVPDPEAHYRDVLMPMKARWARFYARRAGPATDLALLCATLRRLIGGRPSGRRVRGRVL